MAAEKKRFYWIKLKENFFDLETIDWLISQKNGCEYIVLYQKLCLLTANKGGNLQMQVGEMLIPYDFNKIARDTKFDIDTVIVAMELFKKIGLIYEQENGVLHIPYVNELVGSETPAAVKKRAQRQKRKALQGDNVGDNVPQEIEYREKSIEYRDLDTDADVVTPEDDYSDPVNKLEPFRYDNVFLSDKQVEALLNVMDVKVFDAYVDKMHNYPNIKNHYETMLKWHNEDRQVKC